MGYLKNASKAIDGRLETCFRESNEVLKVMSEVSDALLKEGRDDEFDEVVAASKELLRLQGRIEKLRKDVGGW